MDYINFDDVFTELQSYRDDNNGSLTVPTSHPSLARIVDNLASGGIEDLAKRRWNFQMAALKDYKEEHGDINVPVTHPTLGSWVSTQLNHYKLHQQNRPHPLTKKRIKLLADVGFHEIVQNMLTGASIPPAKVKNEPITPNTPPPIDQDPNNEIPTPEISRVKEEEIENPSATDVLRESWIANDGGEASENGSDKQSENVEHAEPLSQENAATAPDNSNQKKRIKGKCDLCEKPDAFRGHTLQKCKECGVLVHELCYAMIPTDVHDPDFVCHACKAIGTEIEVNVPSVIGGCGEQTGKNRELMTQEERPTECVLCSVDSGVHAMHPIYDTWGSEGRQLVLPESEHHDTIKERRLAWAHTLCAQFINVNPKTKGCVYGCDKNGKFYGDETDEEIDEGSNDENQDDCHICGDGGDVICCDGCDKVYHSKCLKVDPDCLPYPWHCPSCTGALTTERLEELKSEATASHTNSVTGEAAGEKEENSNNESDQVVWSHRFVIAGLEDGKETVHTKAINEHRNKLVCCVCGIHDRKQSCLRIPVQCIAGDDNELKEWKARHRSLNNSNITECSVAMHVGCAQWNNNYVLEDTGKRCRTCYYYTGVRAGNAEEEDERRNSDINPDPVAHCYCRLHAREIKMNKNNAPAPENAKSGANRGSNGRNGRKRKPGQNGASFAHNGRKRSRRK